MSMSRHEATQLFRQMQERSQKVDAVVGLPLGLGLRAFEARLQKEEGQDKPSVPLRQMAQLTKHYLEELDSKTGRADPAQIFVYYNAAATLLEKGYDVQTAIRRARLAVNSAEKSARRMGVISSPEELAAMQKRAKAEDERNNGKKPDKRKLAARDENPLLA